MLVNHASVLLVGVAANSALDIPQPGLKILSDAQVSWSRKNPAIRFISTTRNLGTCSASTARPLAGELDGAGVEAGLSWEDAAVRYGVPVEISGEDLEELIESSTVVIPADEHRNGHSEIGDFSRWGRLSGLAVLQRYGQRYFSLLARHRWGDPEASRELSARVTLRRGVYPPPHV
jgi:hypothetical protein